MISREALRCRIEHIINELQQLDKDLDDSVECPTCGGKGYVQIGEGVRGLKQCEDCKGTGFVSKESEGLTNDGIYELYELTKSR